MDQQPQPAGHAAEDSLANRYGRPQRTTSSSRRRFGTILAVIGLAIAVLITIWFTWSATEDRLNWKDVGFNIISAQEATVTFQVTKEPEATVTCGVQVLAENYAVVGYDTVVVGADEATASSRPSDMTQYYKTELRTDGEGVSGTVDDCWYYDEEPSDISYLNTDS